MIVMEDKARHKSRAKRFCGNMLMVFRRLVGMTAGLVAFRCLIDLDRRGMTGSMK